MSAAPLPLPDLLTDWTLVPAPRPDGAVDLVFSLSGPAGSTTVCLLLSRDEARAHARAVLRAAGDGAGRTHRPEGAR
ncbi:hypothetical protein [Methylobacterium oryzisoli]|uniref:hypothetical protein n=1 Tax=Methylobacterium oryzisoli TaxID=3385502 RepID=UPI003892236C